MSENRWVTPADADRRSTSPWSGRALAFGVLFTIAVASVAGGVLLDRYVLLPRILHVRPPDRIFAGRPGDRPGRRPTERGRQAFHDRLAEELSLTTAQRARMDSLMDIQERELHAAHESVQPRIDSIVSDTRSKLNALLSPEQRQKLDSLRASGAFGSPAGRGRRRGPGGSSVHGPDAGSLRPGSAAEPRASEPRR